MADIGVRLDRSRSMSPFNALNLRSPGSYWLITGTGSLALNFVRYHLAVHFF